MKQDRPRKQKPGKRCDWYVQYWAQTWYTNTFLVQRPDQIAKSVGPESEWNNLNDSGCNFTCLAMIVGIDPARLASLLSTQTYFAPDWSLPSRYLTGQTGGLVWDQNAPHAGLRSIALHDVWHSMLDRRVSIRINFVRIVATTDHTEARLIVADAHDRGRHVICGPEAHSHLVAGTIGRDYFVWDPDETALCVEDNLAGNMTLRRMFNDHGGEPIEFWEYQVELVEADA